jgi:sulfur-carrier protein
MVRVSLPAHLRDLAEVSAEIRLETADEATTRTVLDALEAAHPPLRGTIRDPVTGRRRPFVRFFVGEQDLSHEPEDAPLPDGVATGELTFRIVGAMAGG